MKWIAPALLILALLLPTRAQPHDHNRDHDDWYAALMQSDNPTQSCCGVADAYWCDDISVKDGKTFCGITDDQTIPRRPSPPIGTQIEIPNHKLKWDKGNPTGHAIVFLSSGGAVFCYVQGTGI